MPFDADFAFAPFATELGQASLLHCPRGFTYWVLNLAAFGPSLLQDSYIFCAISMHTLCSHTCTRTKLEFKWPICMYLWILHNKLTCDSYIIQKTFQTWWLETINKPIPELQWVTTIFPHVMNILCKWTIDKQCSQQVKIQIVKLTH